MIRGLDSLRALAFLTVFFFHLGVLPCGYLGVQLFFVLSGFLITGILVVMRERHGPRDYFVHFYGRRTLRIFPLYYAYLAAVGLVTWVVVVRMGRDDVEALAIFGRQWPWAATYTFNFLQATVRYEESPLLSHLWSLAVEEQFYLEWPLVVLGCRRRLAPLLLTVALAGPLVRGATFAVARAGLVPGLFPGADLVVYHVTWSHFDAFAVGGWFAVTGRRPRGRVVAAAALAAWAAGAAAEWLATGGLVPLACGYRPYLGDAAKAVWAYTVLAWVFGLLIAHVAGRRDTGWLAHPLPVWLGRVSYGLYVFHFGVIWAVGKALPGWPLPARGTVALTATVGLAALSWAGLESPLLRLKDRFFPR